jgi:hypothetical protein
MFDNHEPPPDHWDRVIRFVLGGIVGFFTGYFLLRNVGPFRAELASYVLWMGVISGLVVGALAAWQGDRIWAWFRHWWI